VCPPAGLRLKITQAQDHFGQDRLPLRSEEEKKAIEAKAAEVAGGDKVTNEMDVKPKQ